MTDDIFGCYIWPIYSWSLYSGNYNFIIITTVIRASNQVFFIGRTPHKLPAIRYYQNQFPYLITPFDVADIGSAVTWHRSTTRQQAKMTEVTCYVDNGIWTVRETAATSNRNNIGNLTLWKSIFSASRKQWRAHDTAVDAVAPLDACGGTIAGSHSAWPLQLAGASVLVLFLLYFHCI